MLGRVLVVDDDASVRGLVHNVLEADGWTVVEAEDGKDALARLEQHAFDAIVLDLEMPRMDGRSFYREMKRRGTPRPTLILAAHGPLQAARDLGAVAGLQKPFDIDTLSDLVFAVVRTGWDGSDASTEPV